MDTAPNRAFVRPDIVLQMIIVDNNAIFIEASIFLGQVRNLQELHAGLFLLNNTLLPCVALRIIAYIVPFHEAYEAENGYKESDHDPRSYPAIKLHIFVPYQITQFARLLSF